MSWKTRYATVHHELSAPVVVERKAPASDTDAKEFNSDAELDETVFTEILNVPLSELQAQAEAELNADVEDSPMPELPEE